MYNDRWRRDLLACQAQLIFECIGQLQTHTHTHTNFFQRGVMTKLQRSKSGD